MVAPAHPIAFAVALGSPHQSRPSGSDRTVRYHFVIAVRRGKKQNPQRDVLASNAGNLGGAVGVYGACRGLQNN
jgi:hypothetical protein